MDWFIESIIKIVIAVMFLAGSLIDSTFWSWIVYFLGFVAIDAYADYKNKNRK